MKDVFFSFVTPITKSTPPSEKVVANENTLENQSSV
nr:MAG TPA: hypothetical protein [Caudoviricetes sp.]